MIIISTLQELAQEYRNNAQNLKMRIELLEAELKGCTSISKEKELQRDIVTLKYMHNEQMDTYHILKNYYDK